MRSSRTVRRLKIRRPSGTCATPRETIACGGTSRSDSASSVIVPRVGWRRPEIVLSAVVFPAPLLPRIVTISPRPTSSPSTARPPGTGATGTEVGLDHARIALDLAGRTLRDLLAVVQHGHPVGDLHDHPHVVLDQDDGQLQIGDEAPKKVHQGTRFALGH